MAVFFVRFKALDPARNKPYFANMEMPFDNVADALEALKSDSPLVVKRYFAVRKAGEPNTLIVQNVEERTLNLDDVAVLSLSRFNFDFNGK
jgi:hypothetical protein